MAELKGNSQYILKDKIIYALLKYLKTGEAEYRVDVLEKLKDLAAHYKIKIKITAHKPDKIEAMYKFILNNEGYIISINNLYNAVD